MKTEIEIIMVDEPNLRADIIGLENNLVKILFLDSGSIENWDLEDLKQCIKFI